MMIKLKPLCGKKNSRSETGAERYRRKRDHSLPGDGLRYSRGYKEIVRGMQVDMQMQPKLKFEIVVSSEEWEKKTVEAIRESAYTGEVETERYLLMRSVPC